MKAAFSVWDARIAPVFDTARQVHIVEAESGRILGEADEVLPDGLPVQQVVRLVDLGVGTLVCGAISWPLRAMVTASGIQVMPFIAGTVNEVVQAWLGGTMGRGHFVMPGCGGGRGLARGMTGPEAIPSGRVGRGGAGRGGGSGQHPERQGRGWGGGPRTGGVAGTGVCPACGHREPHERGASCAARPCPMCGARMIREW
jgi:predicted Fe-Mo cluster-binding NifX family protein